MSYDESSIERYAGLAGIRRRPAMYIGPPKCSTGLWTIWRECGDNAADRATAGQNNLVHYIFDPNGKGFWCIDAGPGFPVGKKEFEDERGRKEKLSTFYVATGLTHAGANFSGDVISRGTHGIGVKATNATSIKCIFWTFRDGKWWAIEYSEGKLVKDVYQTKAPKLPHGINIKKGTAIYFEPDMTIFGKSTKMDKLEIREWCELTSYLVPNLQIKITNIKGKTENFVSKRGALDFIDKRVAELKCSPLTKVFEHNSKEMNIAVGFSDAEGDKLVNAYTNGLRNIEGGEHLRSFFAALVKSLVPYKGKLEYTPSDLQEGVLGLINYKIGAPIFSGQTKEKLIDDRVYEVAYPQILKAWEEFWKKNKGLALEVSRRAAELRKSTQAYLADKKLIKNVNSAKKTMSRKLSDVEGRAPVEQRELYLVEGDSAGGCFVGKTKIRLINGESKTLKELVKDSERGVINYGYSHSNKSGIHVVPIDAPRKIKRTKKLIEVTLDNGASLRCTRDHKWKLRDGTWCEARDLIPGTSLMPHYERIAETGNPNWIGRRMVQIPGFSINGKPSIRGRWEFVYRLVAYDTKKLKIELDKFKAKGIKSNIHHRNFDESNDHPSNLDILSEYKHRVLHAKATGAFSNFKKGDLNTHSILMRTDKKYRKAMIKHAKRAMLDYWYGKNAKINRYYAAVRAKKQMSSISMRNQISNKVKEWWNEDRRFIQSKRTKKQSLNPAYKKARKLALKNNYKNKFMEIAQNCNPLNFRTFEKEMQKWMKINNSIRKPVANFLVWRNLFKCYDEMVQALDNKAKKTMNHKVVNVRNITLRKSIWVYDASIAKYHNYALDAGVYVHNTAKRARIKTTQAVLPLRGKPLNVMEATKDKINKNEEIAGILAALGIDLSSKDPLLKLRYGKIIFLADPDVDGSHIDCLLMTIFWKFVPNIFKAGKIYLIFAPEWKTTVKGKTHFAFSKEKLIAKFDKKISIQHLKGYGELSPEELFEVAMSPDTRKMIKIDPPNRKGKKYFEALMGKNPATRKQLLGVE